MGLLGLASLAQNIFDRLSASPAWIHGPSCCVTAEWAVHIQYDDMAEFGVIGGISRKHLGSDWFSAYIGSVHIRPPSFVAEKLTRRGSRQNWWSALVNIGKVSPSFERRIDCPPKYLRYLKPGTDAENYLLTPKVI